MKKYFVFSDVHGQYLALVQSLTEAGYDAANPNHILVSVGDPFDRGPDSERIYTLLTHKKDNICIRGNHDVMLYEALTKGGKDPLTLFNCLHNGLDKTLQSFSGIELTGIVTTDWIDDIINSISVHFSKLKGWLESLPIYYETDHYIFVHAGLDPNEYDWKNTKEDFMLWDIKYSYSNVPSTKKKVIIGHHHAFRVRQQLESHGINEYSLDLPYVGNADEHRPVRYKNKIAIDGCTNLTNKVNVLVIEDTDTVHDTPKENTKQDKEPTVDTFSYSFTQMGDGIRAYTTVGGDTYTVHTGNYGIWG